MKDFTYKAHKKLLESLQAKGYSFITFLEYLEQQSSPITLHSPSLPKSPNPQSLSPQVPNPSPQVILRHDVEQRYKNALKFAKIQNQLGIKGTYFFRLLPKCFKPEVVKQIAGLGHEIGYHYDDLAQCKGDYKKAIARFEKNLNTLRAIAPVQTICMDGSPLSKYDNKDLWKREGDKEKRRLGDLETGRRDLETERLGDGEMVRQGDVIDNKKTAPCPLVPKSLQSKKSFQDFGIKGEPYFNIDFDKVFYLTDTGRKWDGWKTSVRDKVPQQVEWERDGLVFHSTQDIINALESGLSTSSRSSVSLVTEPVEVPNQIMFTFHPQRWSEGGLPWFKELVLQNAKNFVKGFLVK